MVLATNDVADAQINIVGARRQVIRRHAVAAQQGEVFNVVSCLHLLAVHGIGETDLPAMAAGHAEAQGKGLAGCGAVITFLARQLPHAGIEEPGHSNAGFLAVTRVSRSKVAVGEPLLENGLGDLPVQSQPLGLLVFLVPVEAKPAQAIEDRVDAGLGVPLDVRIVEPEHHGSAVMAGIEPVEDEGSGTSDVQKTCGRRRKSNAEHKLRVYRLMACLFRAV